jgi:hypothetical protein
MPVTCPHQPSICGRTVTILAVTVVRQLEFAPGQPLDHLTNFLMARDFLRRIDDLQINPLHGIEA